MQGQQIDLRQHGVQAGIPLRPDLGEGAVRGEGVEGQQRRAESVSEKDRRAPPDAAHADHADRPAGKLEALRRRSAQASLPQQSVKQTDPPGNRQRHADRQFSHRVGVGPRRADHRDPARPRRIQIDVIDADAMLADHLKPAARLPADPP